MENNTFTTTKELIKRTGLNLANKLNTDLARYKHNWNHNNPSGAWNTKQSMEHVYLMNKFLIAKITNLQELLHEGLVNQRSEYCESDLHIVKTLLKISAFKLQAQPEFCKSLNYSFEELKLKLSFQTVELLKLTKETPKEYASNYKTQLSILQGLNLDIYQMIYFAFEHMQHHFEIIEIQQSVTSVVNESQVNNKLQFAH